MASREEGFQDAENRKNTPVFFSDGSADNPEHPELTKAAWSLVMFKGNYNQGLESFSVTRNTMVGFDTSTS